jgi:two-component system, OmpR family, heavy metal sensor histidine kinase CusS
MLHSFRLKIGLLSLCLSGLLLLGFGSFATSMLNQVGRDRIDRELRALADAQVRKEQPRGHWRRFDDSLRSIYGEDASKQFAVKVTRTGGDLLYASADWPVSLPRQALPLSLASAPRSSPEGPPVEPGMPPPEEDRDSRPPRPRDEPPPRSPPPRRLPVQGPVYATLGSTGSAWRAMTIANEDVTLSVAMSLSGLRAETRRFQRALLVGVPLGLLLIVAGSWLIGHMALRPVNRIARTAESVTAHRLNERIPDAHTDAEFKRLIVLINGMLERLERSFQQATRFSADAAHELKTPLAILQAQIERSLQRAADDSPEQREYAEQLDEVQRLRVILSKLLLLSQADSGQLPLSLARINLADLARGAAEDARMLAPDRKTTVEAPQELPVMGDADLLNQAFQNLVSNAVKFGDPGGAIDLALRERTGQAVFTIANTGRPIPKEDHDRVFDRFYRADKSRSREIEGSGLGLSLAREIVRAHGGDLVLQKSDDQATAFALTLPVAARAQSAGASV